MIQEILDYLLIRSLLMNSTMEEIIEGTSDKESFNFFVNNVASLMETEDFVMLSSAFSDKVSNVIQKYRFDYNKDKELNNKMNYIIQRLQEYKNMSPKRILYLSNEWLKEECKNRELPKKFQNYTDIYYLISLDIVYITGILSFERMEIRSILEYSSLVNIIINKFPEVLENEKTLLSVIRETLIKLQNIETLRRVETKMLKNTIKKIEDNYNISEIPKVEINYSLVKKKD